MADEANEAVAAATKSWRVGDVRITRVVELAAAVPPSFFFQVDEAFVRERSWLAPHFATSEGQVRGAIQAFVIESAGRVIVIDPCLGNDKPRTIALFDHLQTDFLAKLTAAGFPPERVDTVLCTHLHVDHVGWNTRRVGDRWVPTFPNARYLFGRVEWDYWSHGLINPDGDVVGDSVRPVVEAGLADLVDMDHHITPQVRLLPTPGHTPGHVSVAVESGGQCVIISGDVMHHPIQCSDPDLGCNFDADQGAARAMRRTFLARYEGRPIPVLGTHFAHPTAGWVRREGEGWRFDVEEAGAEARELQLRSDGRGWTPLETAG